jgi:hypothetical protein
MYLIFKPSSDKRKSKTRAERCCSASYGAGMQSDKQKAYEQEMLEKQEQENAMPLLRFLIIGIQTARKVVKKAYLKKRKAMFWVKINLLILH